MNLRAKDLLTVPISSPPPIDLGTESVTYTHSIVSCVCICLKESKSKQSLAVTCESTDC